MYVSYFDVLIIGRLTKQRYHVGRTIRSLASETRGVSIDMKTVLVQLIVVIEQCCLASIG